MLQSARREKASGVGVRALEQGKIDLVAMMKLQHVEPLVPAYKPQKSGAYRFAQAMAPGFASYRACKASEPLHARKPEQDRGVSDCSVRTVFRRDDGPPGAV